MSDQDPLDVEITHIEEHDQPAVEPKTLERRPDLLPQPQVDWDQTEHDEDVAVLRLLREKVFRTAILADVQLPDMPSIEDQVVALHGDLTDVFNDLDDARDGKCDIDWQIDEWRKKLQCPV